MDHRQKKGLQLKSYNPSILLGAGTRIWTRDTRIFSPWLQLENVGIFWHKTMKNQYYKKYWQGVVSLLIMINWSFSLCVFISLLAWVSFVTIRNDIFFILLTLSPFVFFKKAHRWTIGFFERSFRSPWFITFLCFDSGLVETPFWLDKMNYFV